MVKHGSSSKTQSCENDWTPSKHKFLYCKNMASFTKCLQGEIIPRVVWLECFMLDIVYSIKWSGWPSTNHHYLHHTGLKNSTSIITTHNMLCVNLWSYIMHLNVNCFQHIYSVQYSVLHYQHTQWTKTTTFVWHLYNVGPDSKTLGRRQTNDIQMFCVCWLEAMYFVYKWWMLPKKLFLIDSNDE